MGIGYPLVSGGHGKFLFQAPVIHAFQENNTNWDRKSGRMIKSRKRSLNDMSKIKMPFCEVLVVELSV